MPRKIDRVVQGSYITTSAKEELAKEAEKQGMKVASFVADILEKEAKKLKRKERNETNKKKPSTT